MAGRLGATGVEGFINLVMKWNLLVLGHLLVGNLSLLLDGFEEDYVQIWTHLRYELLYFLDSSTQLHLAMSSLSIRNTKIHTKSWSMSVRGSLKYVTSLSYSTSDLLYELDGNFCGLEALVGSTSSYFIMPLESFHYLLLNEDLQTASLKLSLHCWA